MVKKPKLLFSVRYEPYDLLSEDLARYFSVACLQYKTDRFLKKLEKVRIIIVRHFSFGLLFLINKLLKKQISVPVGIFKFSSICSDVQPSHIITVDFYHWSFVQAISYIKRNPNIKLLLLSESKAFPLTIWPKFVFKCFLRYLISKTKYIDAVIVPTKQGLHFFKQHIPNIRVIMVPAPVDTDSFKPVSGKKFLPNEILRILMNARFAPYKRHEDLLQAAVRLLNTGKKFHISLIGRADEGAEHVKNRVKNLGLEEYVTFLDPVPKSEIPMIYHLHDVLVLPSYNEAVGLVVPEAMACGMPTITSDTVGANVYVKENETGFIFKTHDVCALTAQLLRFYDAELLEQMGTKGRLLVHKDYSIKTSSERFAQAINVTQ